MYSLPKNVYRERKDFSKIKKVLEDNGAVVEVS